MVLVLRLSLGRLSPSLKRSGATVAAPVDIQESSSVVSEQLHNKEKDRRITDRNNLMRLRRR